jgi:proteic killer suppression protein
MILSWGDGATQRFSETGKSRRFGGMDAELALERLAMLNAASSLADLSPFRSVGLHKLKGSLRDYWAMSINGPWRLCFRFHNGNAHDVKILDYH